MQYHEHVLKSSLGTVCRYRAATQHLEAFATQQVRSPRVHEVRPQAFAAYLRNIEVAPNGHKNAAKRKLRDKGIQYILETCRAMYNFAVKRRHLPPYTGNPFKELPLERFKIEDAKPIFVFNEATELAFFTAASDWAFPIHFTLAKTGLRVGELVHLLVEDVDLEGGWHEFDRYHFLMDEQTMGVKPASAKAKGAKGQRQCIVVVPKAPASGNPWSWRACYWDAPVSQSTPPQ
jgi:integrase